MGRALRRTFVFLIDGLGYYQLDSRHMPFLNDLIKENGRTIVIPPLGYSNAVHGSFWTGCQPRTHGLWTYLYKSQSEATYGVFKYLFWDQVLERIHWALPVGEKFIMRRFFQLRGQTVPLNIPSRYLSQLSARFTPIVLPSTQYDVPSIFDICRREGVDFSFALNSEYGKDTVIYNSSQLPLKEGTLFNYVLLSVDGHFHHFGPSHPSSKEHMSKIDNFLKEFLSKISSTFHDYAYVIMSDHGLCPVQNRVDLHEVVLDSTDPTDLLFFTDATMTRFWYKSKHIQEKVETCLAGLPYGHVLNPEEKAKFGVDFKDDRFGQSIFLYEPGWMPSTDSWGMSLGRGEPIAAVHGYDPYHELSQGFLTSNLELRAPKMEAMDLLPTLLDSWGMKIPEHIEGRTRLGD